MYRVSHALSLFALCLAAGIALAMLWANVAPQTYQDMVEWRLIDGFAIGYPNPDAAGMANRTLTLHYLVNNGLMALFFLLAGKEVWEALSQKSGALRGGSAVVPVGATVGAMTGPILIYLAIAATTRGADWQALRGGWAIPAAGDLVLTYIIGRTVLGRRHPGLRLLMLVAITSDCAALVGLGLFFPVGPLQPLWLILPLAAPVLAWGLVGRSGQTRQQESWQKRFGPLPWAIAGVLSWYGVQQAGLHPAFGLLPLVPAIPHANRAFGFFAEAEDYLTDPLNRIAHLLTWPVAATLFLFGLINGGGQILAYAPATSVTFFALLLGKPLGLLLGATLTAHLFGRRLPDGISPVDLALLGLIAGCSFTVPMLLADATLPGGAVLEAAKLGLIASLVLAPLAVFLAWMFRLGRWQRLPTLPIDQG